MKPIKANKLIWLMPLIFGTVVFIFQNCSGFSPVSTATSNSLSSVGGGPTNTESNTPLQFNAQFISESQVNVSWASGGSQFGFIIERALSNGGPFTPATGPGTFTQIASLTAETLNYSDKALTPQTLYYYRMHAIASDGTASASTATVQVTTPAVPVTPPTAPSGLTATAFAATIVNLAWVDNSNNESYFSIERSTDGVTFTAAAVASANTTTFQDVNLLAATTYYYRMRAINSAGDSTYTTAVTVTTLAAGNTATYAYVSANILGPNCVECHNASLASGGYDYSTYNAVSRSVTAGNATGSILYKAITQEAMPPGGALTALQMSQIVNWINAGGANN